MNRRSFLQWLGVISASATEGSKAFDPVPPRPGWASEPDTEDIPPIWESDSISQLPTQLNRIIREVNRLRAELDRRKGIKA